MFRRRSNIKTTLGQCLVFAELPVSYRSLLVCVPRCARTEEHVIWLSEAYNSLGISIKHNVDIMHLNNINGIHNITGIRTKYRKKIQWELWKWSVEMLFELTCKYLLCACKAKMQYLFTFQVSRYCLLTLTDQSIVSDKVRRYTSKHQTRTLCCFNVRLPYATFAQH